MCGAGGANRARQPCKRRTCNRWRRHYYEKAHRNVVAKSVRATGLRDRLLYEAVLTYQKGLASAWKSARSARVPLAEFIDELKRRGVPFRTDEDLLKEQVEELLRAGGRR